PRTSLPYTPRFRSFVTVPSGTGPFTYQWWIDGVVAGNDGPALSVPTGARALGDHTVQVVVGGQCAGVAGTVTNTATLTVDAPTIGQLSDLILCSGQIAALRTSASGPGPLRNR